MYNSYQPRINRVKTGKGDLFSDCQYFGRVKEIFL